MRLIADESVDAPVVESLRAAGFDIIYVLELSPGVNDNVVLNWSVKEKRLLLTVDKDFGELIFRNKRSAPGVILYRLAGLSNEEKSSILLSVLKKRGKNLSYSFTVITKDRVRIRRLL